MTRLTVDVSGKCNLNCEPCYQYLDGSELTIKQIEHIVKDNPHASVVNIGGGEPMQHKNIIPIIQLVYDAQKKAHISTNATIIPKEILTLDDAIKNNTSIQVSINAATKETYKAVTGHDLFERVLQNVELLKSNYHTTLSAMIYRTNFHEVESIMNLGEQLGLPVRFGLVLPAGKGKNVEKITPEEANWLRGTLLLKEIAKPGVIYGPLVHQINCPILASVYNLGNQKGFECLKDKVYHNSRGTQTSCEFL
jgi:MoaA/NifB/PqqE/SkfB family radical SAM enzyme